MIFAGIGCRRMCSGGEIAALVRRTAVEAACRADALAAPAFKSSEAGLHEAATLLALELRWIEDDALRDAQSRCVTFSDAVRRHVGVASVAEAAALAASGMHGRLLLARRLGGNATCALATDAPA